MLLVGTLFLKCLFFPTFSFSTLDTLKYLDGERKLGNYPHPIQASILTGLCLIYYNSDTAKSTRYANEILDKYGAYERKPYVYAFPIAHYVLGRHFQDTKNYSEALDNYFKAEDYMIKGYQSEYLGTVYLNIGNIYLRNGDFQNAINYLRLSYRKALNTSNRYEILEGCLISLSNLYIQKQVFDSAHYYTDIYISRSLNKNSDKNLAMAYLLKTKILNNEKHYIESNNYAFKGLSFVSDNTDVLLEFQLYLNIALNYSFLRNDINALYYMNKAGEFFEHDKVKNNPSDYYLIAGNIYRNLKETDLSSDYYARQIDEDNKIIEEKNAFIQKNLQKQFFIHQQKKEIDLLQENNLIKEENLKRNRILLYSLTSLAALLIATSGIIIFMQREKYKSRRIITAQRAELTRKQYLEELHDAEMKAATGHIQGQERERERLAKELHDSIGGTLAGIKMELESLHLHNKSNTQLQKITHLVGNTYNEVRAISHNFAIPDLMKGDFQDNLKNMIYNIPGKNGLHIQLSVYQKIKWDEIENNIKIELYRIIQESVANIIKHAAAKNADIQIVEDENCLNITIEDDGKGFDVSNFKKGLGIRNIKARIDLLNGTFDLDSSPNNGTLLYFNVPLISN